MPGSAVNKVVARLKRAAGSAAGDSDRDLLTRFLKGQDEAAFETLVRRHERLVRSAISKVLADPSDVEDAFQATFLVLVRRAKQLDDRAGLGPWLYGVAHRVAVKARTAGRTRKWQEARATPAGPTTPADLSWQEACDLLHAELDRLPETYRAPLLLCYLEGKTRDEAAAALGMTVAAVRGRLERGREMLRVRLGRRGVALSVGLLAAVAAPRAAEAGSAAALAAVLNSVRGSASAQVVALSREAVVTSVLSKLTRSAVLSVGLVAALATLTAAIAGTRHDAPKPDEKPLVPKVGGAGPAGNPAATNQTPGRPPARVAGREGASRAVHVTVSTPAPPRAGGEATPAQVPRGTPVAGATVRVWDGGRQLAEGKTDASGRAEFTIPASAEGFVVTGSAPGFAPDWVEHSPAPGGSRRTPPSSGCGSSRTTCPSRVG